MTINLFAAQVNRTILGETRERRASAKAKPFENDYSTLAATSRPLYDTLERPLPVTVRADDIALFNLTFDVAHRVKMNLIHLKELLFAFAVVKIHHVVGILNTAVSTRTRFNLMQVFAVLGV